MRAIARIAAEAHGAITVAKLVGEVDMSNAQPLATELRALLDNRSEALIVDLEPTSYLDSSGITLLFGLAEELGQRQQQLHLVVPTGSHLGRVLAIVGLDKTVPTHATLATALESAR
jgi:anti-sigma B factor antagonist